MTINWLVDERIICRMHDYLEDILAEASNDFDGKDVTPAVSDLFQVNIAYNKNLA